ncbi:MAG: hypothetical protein PHS54_06450 [Clostridia bacterium]|nr:hypothetical protein [Clostridia bacterium]
MEKMKQPGELSPEKKEGYSKELKLIGRENENDPIDLGAAYYESPVGKITVLKDKEGKGQYDTHSGAIADIPEIGEINLGSMYNAPERLKKVLTAHGIDVGYSLGANTNIISEYYDPRKKEFISVGSPESEMAEQDFVWGKAVTAEKEIEFWKKIGIEIKEKTGHNL